MRLLCHSFFDIVYELVIYCLTLQSTAFKTSETLSFLVMWQNNAVTEAIQKVAEAYDCKIVEGVLSHQMKQKVIDGSKVVLSVSNPETRVDDVEFEENEVYAIDIVASTGDGKVIAFIDFILMTICIASFIATVLTIFEFAAKAIGREANNYLQER